MRTIVYSAIYGGYDKPINQCLNRRPVLFSDMDCECDWNVKVVNRPEQNNRMKAKYFKCNPDNILNCDVSIWIDGSGTIKTGQFVKVCLELLGDCDMAAIVHPDRDCIYEEAEFCHMFEKYICEDVIIPNLDIKLYNYTIDNLIDFAMNDDSVMWSGRCVNTGANYPKGNFVVNSYQ